MRSADPRPRSRGTPSSGRRRRRSYSALVSVSRIPRGRQMQFILVKRNALPPPRGDQGPSHPTQIVTKALFGLILWRNDGWIPFLLRTLLCLCGEYEMSTHCYVHILLVCLFSDALTRILRFAILCSTKVSAVRLSIAIDFLSSALFVSGFNKR